jgi:hypothetical protein
MWRPVERYAADLGYTNDMEPAAGKAVLQQALREGVRQSTVDKLVYSYVSRWTKIVESGGAQIDNVSRQRRQLTKTE